MQQAWDALGDEKWREYSPARERESDLRGRDASDKPFGGKAQGSYSKSLENAQAHVRATLGQPMTAEAYLALHETATAHLHSMYHRPEHSWRDRKSNINVELLPEHAEPQGIAELKTGGDMYYGAPVRAHVYGGGDDEGGSGGQMLMQQRPMHRLSPKAMDTDDIRKRVNQHFADHYDEVARAGDDDHKKIAAVARVTQSLQRLHPFSDGNTRTLALVRNKLLTEAGLHPAIMADPKRAYLMSHDTWTKDIQEGLERWKQAVGTKTGNAPAPQPAQSSANLLRTVPMTRAGSSHGSGPSASDIYRAHVERGSPAWPYNAPVQTGPRPRVIPLDTNEANRAGLGLRYRGYHAPHPIFGSTDDANRHALGLAPGGPPLTHDQLHPKQHTEAVTAQLRKLKVVEHTPQKGSHPYDA
jgi:hypothetical protein